MISLLWWLRVIGIMYLVHFVAMVVARAPIRALGPPDTLDRARSGDPIACFVVDTWVIFGLENAAIGIALLLASRSPGASRPLVWAVIGIEVLRGIVADIYMIFRTGRMATSIVWIIIHTAVIVTGVVALPELIRGLASLESAKREETKLRRVNRLEWRPRERAATLKAPVVC